MFYVGIDLGTYLCRFILAQDVVTNSKIIANKIKILNYKTKVIDFGNMVPGASISKKAMFRIENAFKMFSKDIAQYKEKQIYCVATAALRYAREADSIIDVIKKKFDIKIEIISPKQEIYLAALGCNPRIKHEAIVIDIGSGSTELCYVKKNKNNENLAIYDYISIEIGLSNNNISHSKKVSILDKLEAFIKKYHHAPIIVSKCYALKIAYNYFNQNTKIKTVEGKQFRCVDLFNVLDVLNAMNDEELMQSSLIGVNKVKLIKKGLPWIQFIFEAINSENIILSECGLKEGIVYYMHQLRIEHLLKDNSKKII